MRDYDQFRIKHAIDYAREHVAVARDTIELNRNMDDLIDYSFASAESWIKKAEKLISEL